MKNQETEKMNVIGRMIALAERFASEKFWKLLCMLKSAGLHGIIVPK